MVGGIGLDRSKVLLVLLAQAVLCLSAFEQAGCSTWGLPDAMIRLRSSESPRLPLKS
jgi:hypothetical protein